MNKNKEEATEYLIQKNTKKIYYYERKQKLRYQQEFYSEREPF